MSAEGKAEEEILTNGKEKTRKILKKIIVAFFSYFKDKKHTIDA